jgi:hypothetical protein
MPVKSGATRCMVADGGGREPKWDDKPRGNSRVGRSIPGEPVAGKLARRVRRGGRGNTVRLCALPLPYVKVCAAGRGAESLTQSGEARRNASGSSDLPEGESLGDKSLSEKQGTLEDAEGIALQDPRDTAKARLPESQSPAVEPHTRCYSV